MTRSERTYYLVFAGYNLSWAFLGAVYPLFLLSRGLDLFEINAILAVFLFANFAFEVPTGAVADLFGRKVSFLLACLVRAVAFAVYFNADSFGDFVVAEVIDAIGNTLASGALDAWAVDGMRDDGDDSPADRLFSRGKMISHAAMIASGLAGGYAAEVDIAYPWLMGVAGFAVTGVVAGAIMREVRPVTQPAVRGISALAALNPLPAIRGQIRGGLGAVLGNPTLRFLCLLTGLIAFAQMPAMQLWPTHLTAISSAGTSRMGWVWAAINVAALAGSGMLPWLRRRMSRRTTAVVVTLVRAVGIALAAVSVGFGKATVGLVAHFAGMGASDPLLGAWMNEHAIREQRATVLSIQAMAFMFGGSAGLLVVGVVARAWGAPMAWGVAAVVLLGCAVLVWSADAEDATAEGDASAVLVP